MAISQFKYYENNLELAVLELFQKENYGYICGYDIHRENSSIIYDSDFKEYMSRYSLNNEEYLIVKNYLELIPSQSLYKSSKEFYKRLINGFNLKKQNGAFVHINFLDFEDTNSNIFKVINQYEYCETTQIRRPDIIVFINGIPVSIFELKNPADETVNIYDAFEQTTKTYARDIPSLMRFDLINVISDGVNNKYGSLFSGYEFYFKWNSPDGESYSNSDGPESLKRLIEGLYDKQTLLNIIKNYIFFPDNSEKNEVYIPKYYQYYGAEAMFANIYDVYKNSTSSKGGTYWGATGCGKSLIMLYLAKKISTCSEMSKPTVLLVTDRTDLDEQLAGDFENATQFLVDANSRSVESREDLKNSLKGIQSGGIYLMTIQKFSEDINLLSTRRNIIIISDEAHRTQTNTRSSYQRRGEQYKKVHPFGECIRNSFPNAIYVGFTGTPIDATLRTFGDVKYKYTMKQSKDDGSTVGIFRLNGPREVQLDEKLARICDEYYRLLEEAGANPHQIEASKREMSKIEKILGAPDRLDTIVNHFIQHYEYRCTENSTVNQKAMFVCYNREIAYEVYKRIISLRPEWNIKRKIAPEYEGQDPDTESIEIEKVKLVATVNQKKDSPELKELLGTDEDRRVFAREFKDDKSNFKIAIVVDMWITGFDVPSLDTMYLDKPVETHNLIQTISRVNRVFKGKDQGLIVDYIGLEGSLALAMRLYNGDITPVEHSDVAFVIFKDFMSKVDDLLAGFDYSSFFTTDLSEIDRLSLIQKGGEFVMSIKDRETNFMGFTLRIKKAFDICAGDPRMETRDVDKMQYFMCVRSYVYKLIVDGTPDEVLMNRKISELVNKAISSTYDGQPFDFDNPEDVTDLFSDEFLEKIENIKMPFTKYQALIKLLKKAIKEFGHTNILKATVFSEKLKKIIERYNARNEIELVHDVVEDVMEGLSEELQKLFKELQEEKKSFEAMGITYDEKAFYDILVAVAEKYNFKDKISDEKFIELAKEIKKLVSNKSKYTDWTNRQDIRDELYSDVAKKLYAHGFPPKPIDDVYDEIMKQVENFKKYND